MTNFPRIGYEIRVHGTDLPDEDKESLLLTGGRPELMQRIIEVMGELQDSLNDNLGRVYWSNGKCHLHRHLCIDTRYTEATQEIAGHGITVRAFVLEGETNV